MGPSILNLANLIRMPSGCGEQNMLNFVPNIMILNYLKVSTQYIIFNIVYWNNVKTFIKIVKKIVYPPTTSV